MVENINGQPVENIENSEYYDVSPLAYLMIGSTPPWIQPEIYQKMLEERSEDILVPLPVQEGRLSIDELNERRVGRKIIVNAFIDNEDEMRERLRKNVVTEVELGPLGHDGKVKEIRVRTKDLNKGNNIDTSKSNKDDDEESLKNYLPMTQEEEKKIVNNMRPELKDFLKLVKRDETDKSLTFEVGVFKRQEVA